MDVLAQVRATIDAHGLLPQGSGVVAAVSGGPDSLCLLHVLLQVRDAYGIRLHVAHLDHGLRPEAAADAAFVASLAAAWQVPCTCGHADVRALAREEHRSVEEAARLARYRFLAQVACAQGASIVAVGHNADDQVETVLMHCLRGAGLAGLRGMSRRARWPEAALAGCPAPTLIRPLLDVPRQAIEAYDQAHGLEPRLDLTNLDITPYRNRIRHELVPLLETYNPQIRRILRHTADVLADDYDCLQQALQAQWPQVVLHEAREAVALRRGAFRDLPASQQRGVLRRAIVTLRRSLRDVGWLHLERARRAALVARSGTLVTLPAGLVLDVSYDRLVVRPTGRPRLGMEMPALDVPERPLVVPGRTPLAGGWALEAALGGQRRVVDERHHLCLDADRLPRGLCLRTRRPGDRFQPRGLRGHHKSVKAYMIDARVPRAWRDHIPLLDSEAGILWVVGWRASELAVPGPEARRFLCLSLVPPTGAQP